MTLLSVSNVGISFGATELFKNITVTVAEDAAAAKRVFDAMMQMHKIDIAVIEAARRG